MSNSTRYEVGEVIGRGGMGVVHRGRDLRFEREVALKFLRSEDTRTVERLLREARAQARVSHENVARVFDVGELGGHPFIAMQLVLGPSLRRLGPELPERARARILRDVALAVHAAHRVGVVHRDLKPSNILCAPGPDGEYKPYVIDFGLARALDTAGLTLAGEVLGTPGYMAPELALGRHRDVDRRTDVYALGAILYELLTGVPPFAGRELARVLDDIVEREPTQPRRVRPLASSALSAIALRCLRKEPAERYDSARAVAEELDRYLRGEPIRARAGALRYGLRRLLQRRGLLLALGAAAALGVVATGVAVRLSAQRALEAQLEPLVQTGRAALAQASTLRQHSEQLFAQARATFEQRPRAEAEAHWTAARASTAAVDRAYARASQAFEAALEVARDRAETRALLADTLLARVTWAEARGREDERDEDVRRLRLYDDGGQRWALAQAPAELALLVSPAGATVSAARYEADNQGKLVESALRPLGAAPLARVPLARGSYVLTFAAPGHATVRYPVMLARGERLALRFELPPSALVPPGFVFVPAGRAWTGVDDERRRQAFALAPKQRAETGPYLISRTETTFGEWIQFLETLPAAERSARSPRAERPEADAVALAPAPEGGWRFTFRPGAGRTYSARTGELFRYQRRTHRALADWTRFPVIGISGADALAYVRWLDRSGRLPGARLCTALEWERAARGADEREHPHGHRLGADDANIDVTYARDDWGPDVVGAHPASRSPFGIDDLAGNAFEFVAAPTADGRAHTRGGGYNFNAGVNTLVNPNDFPPTAREVSFGVRVCATWPRPSTAPAGTPTTAPTTAPTATPTTPAR